jgi:FO synthase
MNLGDHLVRDVSAGVRAVLERSLEGRDLERADVETLLGAQGRDLQALCMVADAARAQDVGDEVSYVICRNINFTNVCYVGCSYCGFSRHKHEADAYDRGLDDILERARDAVQRGASEVCIQGGIHPNKDGFWYRDIASALRAELPGLHLHAFSPEEIDWGHRNCGDMPLRDYLAMLRDAGLGTIPGTAAEILHDEVRRVIAPRKIMSERWFEIVGAAHEVGLRSTCTIMYGHVEQPHHIAHHFDRIRELQKRTGGFTEFVPLGFIHHNTALYREHGARAGASMPEDLRLIAIARLFLRPWITNVQMSWVKMGKKMAQVALTCGANDFGGTLMEESISNAAGSEHGDHIEPEEIERLILETGRKPYERTTTYGRRTPGWLERQRAQAKPAARAPSIAAQVAQLGPGY